MATSTQDHPLLVERRAVLLQADQIGQRARREGRDCTAEESAEIDGLLAKAKQLQAQWDESPQPLQTSQRNILQGYGGGTPTQRSLIPALGTDGGSVAASLFGHKTASDGYSSFGDFLASVDSGRFDTRLRAANREGVDSEGGFLTPEMFSNQYIDAAIEKTVLVKRCRLFPMQSDTLHISGFDGNDHSSSLLGGVSAAWEAELSTLDAQTTKHRRISFHAKKLMVLNQTSNELLTDAPAYERMLGDGLIAATAWELDRCLLRGTGAGQPLGAINATSAIEVAKVSGQDAATVWFRNLIDMFARLHPGCYGNAIWCINPTVIPAMMTMDVHADTAGSASLVGDGRYEPFKESNGSFTLFGRPVEVTEKLPVLGTKGDVVLLDPSMYGLALRQDVVVEKSQHVGFSSDSTYFRSKMRVDGMPLWASAMTPRNGDSLSWCITLATRG